MAYGDKPFGLRDVKLTNADGTVQVDLPASMTFSFSERVKGGELSGDDKTLAVVSFSDAVEWELSAGGLPLAAYGLMTGRTATAAGTTPNQTSTLSGAAQEAFPYFKVYGTAIDDEAGDVHCKLFKCKVTGGLKGQFSDGAFWSSGVSGIGIDDESNGIFEFVQHETATALPTT